VLRSSLDLSGFQLSGRWSCWSLAVTEENIQLRHELDGTVAQRQAVAEQLDEVGCAATAACAAFLFLVCFQRFSTRLTLFFILGQCGTSFHS